MWPKRLLRKRKKSVEAEPLSADRVRALLAKEVVYDRRADFLAAILSEIEPGQPLTEAAARLLIGRLRGTCDGYGERNSAALSEMERFWHKVAERTGDPLALCCHAEAVLGQGRETQALAEFFDAFERRPELYFEFGGGLGPVVEDRGLDAILTLKLVQLRAVLVDDGEDVRELYGELLEEFAGSEEALARIRQVGREIDEAERSGQLPRSLLRRGASRRPGQEQS